jgi:acylphosphatase
MAEKIRVHVFISGRVQRVFFRIKTKKKADSLGIFGWVKNLKDGRVEAVFEGEKNKVEKIIKWTQHGPLFAKVKNFVLEPEEQKGEFSNFEIRYKIFNGDK